MVKFLLLHTQLLELLSVVLELIRGTIRFGGSTSTGHLPSHARGNTGNPGNLHDIRRAHTTSHINETYLAQLAESPEAAHAGEPHAEAHVFLRELLPFLGRVQRNDRCTSPRFVVLLVCGGWWLGIQSRCAVVSVRGSPRKDTILFLLSLAGARGVQWCSESHDRP